MTRLEFCQALGDIEEQYLLEAQAPPQPIIFRRKAAVALAAAILAALLMGAALVSIYGDSIQSYLQHYWNAVTRQEMDEAHLALLDNLSQEIGLSQSQEAVTVTVDSALVGNDSFFLLLRVEGLEFSKQYSYEFGSVLMEVAPSPANALTTYGVQFQGIDGDGAVLILMDYNYSTANDAPSQVPFQVDLTLENLRQYPGGRVLAQGTWKFHFTLDRSQPIPVLHLPDAPLKESFPSASGILQEIQVTATGIRFRIHYDAPAGAYMPQPKVVLKSGIEVSHRGGSGTTSEDGLDEYYSYLWSVPINIDDIAAIRFGDTVIQVSQ